jgi:hypothetical protein
MYWHDVVESPHKLITPFINKTRKQVFHFSKLNIVYDEILVYRKVVM